jgi:hypothetical protein
MTMDSHTLEKEDSHGSSYRYLKLGYMSILTFEPTLGPNLLPSPVLCKASRSIDIGSLAF